MEMSRIRPDLACFVYALITLALVSLPANVQAADYEFTALETATGVAINSFNSSTSRPTINNSGVVAYTIRSAPFFWDLVVIDGSSTTTINLNGAAGIGAVNSTSRPFINDSGAVAVGVNPVINNVCLTSSLLKIDPDSTVTVLATANCDGVSGDFRSIGNFLTMNNSGQVAAEVSLNSPQVTAIAIIDDGGIAIVDTVTANRFNFDGSAINNAGVVAYKATEPTPNSVGGFTSVFTGDGMSPQIALPLSLNCGATSAEPDINNNDLIAGQHPLCLVVGSGGVVTEVIVDETANPFTTSIGRLGLNDLDQIVFEASTSNSNGASGLYFGDDPVNDKLIDVGDSLFGETVGNPASSIAGASVRFGGSGGFNDQGQVVFLAATVVDSVVAASYLIRADLTGVGDTDGDGVNDDVDLCAATPAGPDVDANGCSDAQVDGDGDGICDPGAPSDGPSACTGSDNCPSDSNPLQENFDGDSEGDACDTDDDNDGESDADEIACGSDPLDAAETCPDIDTDNDGVPDVDDVCAATVEMAPTSSRGLGRNRWTLENGAFKQGPPQSGRLFAFTIEDTRGCSCSQIIVEAGLGKGHLKYGCSNSAMMEWVINP